MCTMTLSKSIGAIVLAAGNSSRMGAAGPKQLLTYQGQSLVRRAIDTASMSAASPVIVVLGANAGQVYPTIENLGVEIVVNSRWETGMGSSLRAGLERILAASRALDALIIMLCDQPLVTSEDIRSLIQKHAHTNKPLVAASYSATLGVPALIAKSCFDRVKALPDDAGAKALFLNGGPDVDRVEMPCAAVDIDRPEDYEKLRRCSCG
jgi:molybdenum cofactor cytidylyltransferase